MPTSCPTTPALLPINHAIRRADRTLVAHLAQPDGAWLPRGAATVDLALEVIGIGLAVFWARRMNAPPGTGHES